MKYAWKIPSHSGEFKLPIVWQLNSGEKHWAQVYREHNIAASMMLCRQLIL